MIRFFLSKVYSTTGNNESSKWSYDKFEGFVSDLIKIGKKMDEAKIEYSSAMNKLTEGKGNLVTSAEKLKKMGAKAKKALPEAILKRAENDDDLVTEIDN